MMEKPLKFVPVNTNDSPESQVPESNGEDMSPDSQAAQEPRTCTVRVCCWSTILVGLVLVLLGVAANRYVNTVAKSSVETVGSSLLGVKLSLAAMTIGLWETRSTFSDMHVANPKGFGSGDFAHVDFGVFDLSLSTLLAEAVELQEISMHKIKVNIDQQSNSMSNANTIVEHATNATTGTPHEHHDGNGAHHVASGAHWKSLNAVKKRIIADKISFKDITANVCIHPACDRTAPINFKIKKVEVKDVGKNTTGVTLHDLIEIMIHALLIAAMEAAPGQLGSNLWGCLGLGLQKGLDYASVHFDKGEGLMKARNWTSYELDRLRNATATWGDAMKDKAEGWTDKLWGHNHSHTMMPGDSLAHAAERTGEIAESMAERTAEAADDFRHKLEGFGGMFGHPFAGGSSEQSQAGGASDQAVFATSLRGAPGPAVGRLFDPRGEEVVDENHAGRRGVAAG